MTLREFVLKAKARVKDLKMRTFDFPKKREDYLDMQAVYTDDSLIIGGWEVMQEWERPLMRVWPGKRRATAATSWRWASAWGSRLATSWSTGVRPTP
jgi:hypothetical protein